MTELQLKVDAGSRPGGGASQSEIHGPLKYIVRSAHKWGGNGTVPDFNKIRRVLVTRHPEVIAKAFGGDPDRAAAWIKDAWEKYYGRQLKGKGGTGPTYWRGKGKGGSTENDATMSLSDLEAGDTFRIDGEPGTYVYLARHPVHARTHGTAKQVATGKLRSFDLHLKVFSQERRDALAKQGKAMRDGSFPIENEQDLRNAIQAIGRASDPAAAKRHIIKRAKALDLTGVLPDDWKLSG